MASCFCYTFDLKPCKKFLKFRSDGGDECTVLHELVKTKYGNPSLNIQVECKVERNFFVTAELCSTGNITFKAASLLADYKANLNFQHVNFQGLDPLRCVLSLIPHLQLEDVHKPMTSVPIMTSGKSGVIKKMKLGQLSADMQRLLTTGDLSDVILSDGLNKIHAHKVILSARSPVFAKMFQHPMKENTQNCVKISDIPEDALKELISFIYTGNVTLKDTKMARTLYIAADMYAVTDLRKLCSDVLQNVSSDGVLDTLALADLYEDKTLKQSALDFIARNYSQMKNTKNWEVFMKENQALAIKILSFIIEKKG